MENNDIVESIKSFQSTIRKLEKTLVTMTQKGANTVLVKKRLRASKIGLAMLEKKPHSFNQEDLVGAREVLISLFPSIESSYTKAKEGSPQKTLLQRRLKSLERAVQALDDVL